MKIYGQLEKAQAENTTSDTGSLPKGTMTYRTDTNEFKVSNGTTMDTVVTGSASTTSQDLKNLGLSVTVGSNALTVALKQSDGSTDPAAGTGAVKIVFRSSTLTSGAFVERSVTSSLSMTVSSGSTLGTTSGGVHYLMVYAIDNSGTVELAIAGMASFDEGQLWSTTAEGGAGAADSARTLYSTTARTSKAIRLIGRIRISEATAGTWATAPTEVAVVPFPKLIAPTIQKFTSGSGTYTTPTGPAIPLYLKVKMVGAGGGGGGSGTASGGAGSAGGNSTFGSSLLTAAGGSAGGGGFASPGAGGAATVNSPAVASITATGGNGLMGEAASLVPYGDYHAYGGPGGNSALGGGCGGYTGVDTAGGNGAANTGGGGCGGSVAGESTGYAGPGGGAGAYIEAFIYSPATSYSYAVGSGGGGGTAGTSGFAGGTGGSGQIVVEEYYQ